MKKNKKGFTLIELLAVIVIPAIIALIAVPIVLNIIERARKGAFTRSSENVLKASNLYYTNSLLDVSGPEDIRFECINNKCLSSKLDEKGKQISLNIDGNVGEGYVLITNKGEVEFLLQNGSYCAVKYVNNKKITVKEGECNNIDITNDETKPIIDKINTVITSNSITVTVSAYDNESGISGYAFKINDEEYTKVQSNNVYTFNKLTNDKVYKISVKVYNGTYGKDDFKEETGMSIKETEEISLKTMEEPRFSVSPEGWSTSKKVTIMYPEGYTNEYSIDNGVTWNSYIETITVTENGNIIARITDGTNTITKTQMIEKIDNTVPIINLDGVPDKIAVGDDYSLPTSYTVNNNLSGGSATCKVGNTVVTNTKGLSEGEHTINCTVTTGTGITQSFSKSITVMTKVNARTIVTGSGCVSYNELIKDDTLYMSTASGGFEFVLDGTDYSFDYSYTGNLSMKFYGDDGTVESIATTPGNNISGSYVNSKVGYVRVSISGATITISNILHNGNKVSLIDNGIKTTPTITIGNDCTINQNQVTCTNTSVISNSSVSGNIVIKTPGGTCYTPGTEISINDGAWERIGGYNGNYGYRIISEPGVYRIRARYNFSSNSDKPYYSNPSEEFIITITE